MVSESAPATPLSSSPREYWPTKDWQESTPEKQGIDPRLPSHLERYIEKELSHIRWLAGGWGGQFVHILPDLDVVVVITSDFDRHYTENKDIVYELVIPAVVEKRGRL